MAKKNIHVVKHGNGWATKAAGNVESRHRTQRNAIESGRRAAKAEQSELVVHGKDGRIRSKDSYGRDPMPPRDREH